MHVTPRTLLPVLCLTAAGFAVTAHVSQAKPQTAKKPLAAKWSKSKLIKGKFRRPGFAALQPDFEVPVGRDFEVKDVELEKKGLVHIPQRAKVIFLDGEKSLKGTQIWNEGVIDWGGKGHIICGDDTVIENDGTIILHNGYKEGDPAYEENSAVVVNNGLLIDTSQGGGATINANLANFGEIQLNAVEPRYTPAMKAKKAKKTRRTQGTPGEVDGDELPTPTLVAVTGTFGNYSSTFQTTINSTYYGQLSTPGSVVLGGTCKYLLSPSTGFNPGAGPFQVIKAAAIGASDFTAFTSNPVPFSFTHQKNLAGTSKYYELVNYVPFFKRAPNLPAKAKGKMPAKKKM